MKNKIKQAEKEIQEVIKKHELKMTPKFNFQMYRILPDEVQLALRILEKHGMKIIFTLEEKK